MKVICHDVDPVDNACDCGRIHVGNISIASWRSDRQVIRLAIESRLMIQFVAQGLQQQQIVRAIRRGIANATLLQSASAWIFPVNVDAVEAITRRYIHRRLRKIGSFLCTSCNRKER